MVMNNNETNSVMNVDDYENMAVQKSNNAKRVAAGAALFVGGAAVAGGAAYAATGHETPDVIDDSPLTAEDVVEGGNVGNDYQPEVHNETTERVVYVEKYEEPSNDQNSEQTNETQVTWDEKTVVYDENGNVVGSVENGTIQGHNFALFDVDGDNHADYLAIDADGNGQFDDNEIVKYDVSDHVHMGHETAYTKEIHSNNQYILAEDGSEDIARNDDDREIIHNNFEDEKTGESYNGDYAENNRDYNPNADMDSYGNSDNYLAENDRYDGYDDSSSANVDEQYLAENDDEESEPYEDFAYEEDDDDTEDSNYYAENDDEESEPYEDFAYEEDDDDTEDSNYYAENDTLDSYEDMSGEEDLLA